MRREFKIGLFLAGAMFILVVFIFIVGDLGVLFKKQGYDLYVRFASAAGLEKRAVVRIAGVKAGYIKDIQLVDNQAQVLMSIDPDVKIPLGSKATLAALGLLGEKYVEIIPAKAAEYYQPGEIIEGLPAVSFDQMGSLLLSIGDEVKAVGEEVRRLIGGEEARLHFRDAIRNLALLSNDLRQIVNTNREDVNQSLQASSRAFQKFEQRIDEVSENLDELVSLVKNTVEDNKETIKIDLKRIKDLIDRAEESLKHLNNSLDKINRGEGSVGKLISNPELYDRTQDTVSKVQQLVGPLSETHFSGGIRAAYYGQSQLLKTILSFRFWASSDKFLLTQVVRDPWLDRFHYSLQAGWRWQWFSPRVGIVESKAGVGLDYYLFQDRLRFTLEGYDFNRDPRPHFRIWTQYSVTKYIYLLLGIDDFSLVPQREVFFGLGLGLT
ncbi:MAG: MlaD family protein [Candidatus Aminicenantales bacterium]